MPSQFGTRRAAGEIYIEYISIFYIYHFPLTFRAKLRSYSVLDLKYEKQKCSPFLFPPSVFYRGDPVLYITYFLSPHHPCISFSFSLYTHFVQKCRVWSFLTYANKLHTYGCPNIRQRIMEFLTRHLKPSKTRSTTSRLISSLILLKKKKRRHWYVNLANVETHVRSLLGK